ncbi:MAG: DUF4199 domain-containing protein [Bacteroidota bacterium]
MSPFKNMSPLVKVPLKYSLVGGVLIIVLLSVLYNFGDHPLLIPIHLDVRVFIFLLFIYFSVREYKNYYNGGYLHFWQGLTVGVLFYLSVGVLLALFVWIFASVSEGFLDGYIEGAIRGMELKKEELMSGPKVKLSPEEFETQKQNVLQTTPGLLAIDSFLKTCIIGFFMPVLFAVLLRKTESQPLAGKL